MSGHKSVFNFAPVSIQNMLDFDPAFVFMEQNVLTKRKFIDRLKFEGNALITGPATALYTASSGVGIW